MDIDTIYPLVTEAIRHAEALEDRNGPQAREAFAEVSRLEEEIASLVPLSEYEGVIARRGAVRAAIKSHHCGRALELAARYEAEVGIDEALRADLVALKAQAIATALDDQEKLPAVYRRVMRVEPAMVGYERELDSRAFLARAILVSFSVLWIGLSILQFVILRPNGLDGWFEFLRRAVLDPFVLVTALLYLNLSIQLTKKLKRRTFDSGNEGSGFDAPALGRPPASGDRR